MQANPLACALCSRTTHQVSNSSKIIPGHIPNRHTPSPATANAGSGGWSLSSRLEELLCLNMHGKLARISKTNKVHEIYFTCPHTGISNHNYYKVSFFTGSAHIPLRSGFLSAACNLLSTYLSLVQSTDWISFHSPAFQGGISKQKI